MPKPGPRPGQIKLTDAHRDKIRNSKILDRLIGHVEGQVEMSSTQVTAGIALLRKVMPDMTEAEVRATGEINHVHKITRELVAPANTDSGDL